MDLLRLQGDVAAVSDVYARRFGIQRSREWYLLKLHEEVGELTKAHLDRAGLGRAAVGEGELADAHERAYADECADVLAHVLLLARSEGVDLVGALERKWLVHLPS